MPPSLPAVILCAVVIIALFLYVRHVQRRGKQTLKDIKAHQRADTGYRVVQFGKTLAEPPVSLDLVTVTPDPASGSCAYACGHEAAKEFAVALDDVPLQLKPEKLAEREKCPDCIRKMFAEGIIPCCLCGHSIEPGDAVALYGKNMECEPRLDPHLRPDCVSLETDGRTIGCMRWDCCTCGSFFAGRWDGEVFRPSFDGGMSAAQVVFATGKTVVANVGPEGTEIHVFDSPKDK